MSNKKTMTTLSIAASTAFVASLAMGNVANAAEGANPFAMNELSGGYMQLADNHMGKGMEGSCGESKKSNKEGKCGEGKCGGSKDMKKNMEGSCGGSKGKKEGSCGGSKDMKKNMEGNCGGKKGMDKAKEGKCGEGKCGGSK